MSKNNLPENQEPKKPIQFIAPSKLKGGEMFSGVYKSTVEKPDPFNDGKTRNTHYIEDVDVVYGINGTAQLDALLRKREKGTRLDIEYLGKKEITRKNGHKAQTHDFNVVDA